MAYTIEVEKTQGVNAISLVKLCICDREDAALLYEDMSSQNKSEMAISYQEAFAGPPWYEAYVCNGCGSFSKDPGVCGNCKEHQLTRAYPIKMLEESYFREMLQVYTPGLLIIADNGDGGVVGFTTGGNIKLGELIEKKYNNNQIVKKSILKNTKMSPDTVVFYENETCIRTEWQQKKVGGRLNYERVKAAKEMGSQLICGRTVNRPWLGTKEKHFSEFGYKVLHLFQMGIYQINGSNRLFFLAQQSKSE